MRLLQTSRTFASGEGWWDSEWIHDCNRGAIERDSREVVSPAGCTDHLEELKHKRLFGPAAVAACPKCFCSCPKCSCSLSFLISPPGLIYFLSFQASPARIMPESMMSHLMNLFPLLTVQTLKTSVIKARQSKGTISYLWGSASHAMQLFQVSSLKTCNMLHLKYLSSCFFFSSAAEHVNTDEISWLFHNSIHSTGANDWFSLLKKAFSTAKSNWTAVTPNKALM